MSRLISIMLMCLVTAVAGFGCAKDGASASDGGTDGDADGDSDSDADGDADGDSDHPPIDPGVNLDKIAVIDDMEDGDAWINQQGGRYGLWFSYNDETGGSQIPAGDYEMGFDGRSGSGYCATSSGSGFKEWGAGIGFDFSNPGGSDCEGAPPEGRNPYDASSYDGITFYAKGNHILRMALGTVDTLPEGGGGVCTTECDDNFGRTFKLTEEWTQYAFKFENLTQEGWGAKVDFNKKAIVSVIFHVSQNVNFDFSIDDIAFFGDEDTDPVDKTGKGTDNGLNDLSLAAGFRSSSYGIEPFPEREYWASVGTDMASKFSGSTPSAIWIVGEVVTGSDDPSDNGMCKLNFPKPAGDFPDVEFNACDMNEKTLNLFDELGYKVWLQVEPGAADIDTLIHLVLSRYQHHPSVIGFGVDVEWFNTITGIDAEAVSDSDVVYWRGLIQDYNSNYSLMLKHWEEWKMPPSERKDILFLDDAQGMNNMPALGEKFKNWADHFSPAAVAFQVGYDTDKSWWGPMSDPVAELGQYLLDNNSNMKGLFWVDFTLQTVFPPNK